MAQTLDSTLISLGISATINNPKALQAPVQAVLALAQSQALTSGTGALQADRLWADTRTIAISGTDPLDLAGSLVDAVGTTITMARVKLIYVAAAAANTNNLILGNGGANSFINWVGAIAHTVTVRPGGFLCLSAPDVTGYVVTAGTGDIFQVANSGAGTTVTYNVVIMGSSL
jgi:hypothetical protein